MINPLATAPKGGAVATELEPLTVRIAAAVRLTGISRSRLYELIEAGDLATVKVGRSTLIPYGSLKKLVGARD